MRGYNERDSSEFSLGSLASRSRGSTMLMFFRKSTNLNPRKAQEKPVSTVVCWFQRTLKQLEREQTDTQTHMTTTVTLAHAHRGLINNYMGVW